MIKEGLQRTIGFKNSTKPKRILALNPDTSSLINDSTSKD